VARYRDSLTDNVVYVVAGLNMGGTDAASEFVTNTRYLDLLGHKLPRGWESRNIEIVLEKRISSEIRPAPHRSSQPTCGD